jgi:hypothetical protein
VAIASGSRLSSTADIGGVEHQQIATLFQLRLDRMASETIPSPSETLPSDDTPPSISDQLLAQSDRGELFADGLKIRDTERVGAMTPDTDPPEPAPPLDPSRSVANGPSSGRRA